MSAAWANRATATRAQPTRCGTWRRDGSTSAACAMITGRPHIASSPRAYLARLPSASPVDSERAFGLAPPMVRVPVLIVGGVLGALAFPATDWWPLAWIWLVPALAWALALPPGA